MTPPPVVTLFEKYGPDGSSESTRATSTPLRAYRALQQWVVSGRFPAGRPRWEDAGAQLVDDVEPFEQRKLWLLNGSHSMLAYVGSVRGHETIDQAIADPACREWVELFWDEASRHSPFFPWRDRGLSSSAPHPLLEPPHAGPARPHRRRRLNQAGGTYHPNGPCGASRGPDPNRMCNHTCALGAAPARCRCPSQGPRCHLGPAGGQLGRAAHRRTGCPGHAGAGPRSR